jgi:hypothetical protein
MLPWRLALILLAGLSLTGRVHAAEPPPDPKDAAVVINGQRQELEKQLFEFVKNITHSTSTDDTTWEGSGSLRRWNQPVCPLVAGLKDRPVRVWYNASLTAANGMSLNSGSPFDLGANRMKNTNQHAIDSRIKFTDVHVLEQCNAPQSRG